MPETTGIQEMEENIHYTSFICSREGKHLAVNFKVERERGRGREGRGGRKGERERKRERERERERER